MKTNTLLLPALAFGSALNAAALVRRLDSSADVAPQIDQRDAAAPIEAVQDQAAGVEAAVVAAAAVPPVVQIPQPNGARGPVADLPFRNIAALMVQPIVPAPRKAKLKISTEYERDARYHIYKRVETLPGYVITGARSGQMETFPLLLVDQPIMPPKKALEVAVKACFGQAKWHIQEIELVSHMNVILHPRGFPNSLKATCIAVVAEPGQERQANAAVGWQQEAHMAEHGIAEASVIYKLAPVEEQQGDCCIM